MRRRNNKNNLDEFDKTQFVDSELIDKISLWILRIIFKLGGAKEFIDKDNRFHRDSMAYFLEVGKYVDMNSDEFKRSEVLATLKENYKKLENRKKFSSSKILHKNIQQISKLMELNFVEESILEFVILINQYDILEEATDLLGHSLNTTQAKKALATILDISLSEINKAFSSNSKFNKSSIVTIYKNNTHSLSSKISILDDNFADDMLNLDENVSEMIKGAVRPCNASSLSIKDYEYISKDIEIIIPYLKNAIESKQKGVNILLYGLPGTGKTELAKTISQKLQTRLFEISYADEDDESIDGWQRLKAFKVAQSLLSNEKILLMYDEAEDIFDSSKNPYAPKRQENKAWLNRILENNTIATIWITNNIYSIDNAMVRRFDFTIEVPIPNKSKRAEIIKNYSNNLLDEQSIKLLSEHENIAPALISRASKVVSSIETKDKAKTFTQVLNNTLKAQGYKEIEKKIVTLLPNLYNPAFINTIINLEELTQGIQKHPSARLCLYGPAGTGKSAFGKYIAETLNKPLLIKKGSDLISMYVGETEKNIAAAFKEAKEENTVLIFDEVDSFLANREGAQRNWEVTQVNEMLVQMENFEGIFIATTNLMDNLDKASLRRFDLKLEFDYLKAQQAWKIFCSYAEELKLTPIDEALKSKIQKLDYLTPGDFAAIQRQNRFNPLKSLKDFAQRLEDEVAVKNITSSNVMGFLHV